MILAKGIDRQKRLVVSGERPVGEQFVFVKLRPLQYEA